jgi:hypothetical protein
VLPLRNGNFESKGGDVKRLIGQTASIPSALYAPKPLELLDRRSCGAIAVHAHFRRNARAFIQILKD